MAWCAFPLRYVDHKSPLMVCDDFGNLVKCNNVPAAMRFLRHDLAEMIHGWLS